MFITVKQSPCQIGDRGRHVYTAEDVASRLPDPEQAGHDAEQDRRPDQRRGCDRRISKAARQAQPARQARSPRGGRIDWPQPPSRRPPKRSPHEATAEKISPARTKGRIISSINFRTRLFLGSLAERSALLAARRLLVGRLRHPSRFGAGCPLRPYRWRHSDCVFAGAGPVARNLRGSYRLPRESALKRYAALAAAIRQHHPRVLIRHRNVHPSPCLRQSQPSCSALAPFHRQSM